MSSAGSASRRGGSIHISAYAEPTPSHGPSVLVDMLLIASGFVMLAILVILVMQIG